MSTMTTEAPTLDIDDTSAEASLDAPTDAALEDAAMNEQVTAEGDAPQVTPPGEDTNAGNEGGVTATVWHRNVRINAMWSNAANRNAYAAVSGLGWCRVSPANDSCFVTLTALLSHAEATGKRTDVKLDGKVIVEVYVF